MSIEYREVKRHTEEYTMRYRGIQMNTEKYNEVEAITANRGRSQENCLKMNDVHRSKSCSRFSIVNSIVVAAFRWEKNKGAATIHFLLPVGRMFLSFRFWGWLSGTTGQLAADLVAAEARRLAWRVGRPRRPAHWRAVDFIIYDSKSRRIFLTGYLPTKVPTLLEGVR